MDWNTLKGVKDSLIEPFISIKNLLEKHNDKIIIPYSPSHLEDLNKNYEEHKSKIDSDLEFLQSISNNIIIAKYFGVKETTIENRDLIKFFDEIRIDKDQEVPISQTFGNMVTETGIDLQTFFNEINLKSLLPNMEELEQTDSGKVLAKQLSSFFETGNFYDLLGDVSKMNENFQNNPQDFNQLRRGLKEDLKLDSNISNWESLEKLDSYLPNTSLGKSFSESVHEDVNRYHNEPTFFEYYQSAYNHLGLFGFRPDNLTEKNKFSNSIDDSFHSFYGSQSDCFITNDRTLFHRTKALFESFEVNSKLFKTFKISDTKQLVGEIETHIIQKNGG